ncbi:MAG: hypothetical protein WA047_16060 [Phenylobacterium sp.]|uniref:hypothetical protein n=1 Tax=Phenylobacterium sp. TaxID=1871053 RepID=UPI003BB67D85
MSLTPNKRQTTKIASQKQALRDTLWEGLEEAKLWTYNNKGGWLNIPRSFPIILRILDLLSKGKPLSATYLDLWCRTFNDSFVIANKPREMAFASGFSGERAERTWMARIRLLEGLGFIDVKSGPSGPISYILILNPYLVIKEHQSKGMVDPSSWHALMEKMIEIRATDLDPPPPANAVTPEASAAPLPMTAAQLFGVAPPPPPPPPMAEPGSLFTASVSPVSVPSPTSTEGT